jgi:hypothetical protein
VPSEAEIESAIEQGQDSETIRAGRGGVRLPIVGDPTQPTRPEPRLLQITEEGDLQPREPEVDPDQAILDELLADM